MTTEQMVESIAEIIYRGQTPESSLQLIEAIRTDPRSIDGWVSDVVLEFTVNQVVLTGTTVVVMDLRSTIHQVIERLSAKLQIQ